MGILRDQVAYNTPGRLVGVTCGVVMGAGIAVGGMADPTKATEFFSAPFVGLFGRVLPGFAAAPLSFDLTMGVVFAAALATNFVLYRATLALLAKPTFGEKFSIPTYTEITPRLLAGASLFGAGWAMSGFCPAPGVLSIVTGRLEPIVFTASMFAGWAAFKQGSRNQLQRTVRSGEMAAAACGIGGALLAFRLVRGPSAAALAHLQWAPLLPALTPVTQQMAGGVAIGMSVAALMATTGKILGISGILSGIVDPLCDDRVCRILFLSGLVAGGELVYQAYPLAFANSLSRPLWCFALGGLLVGLGTNLANGCTSGHGICGNTRLSKRSMAATATFMAVNGLVGALLLGYVL